ncbi:MAG: histidine phosphotransferase [Rhodobacter sp.]|nr:histidine phosphotransferase [Rhodobacter sp.]MCA3459110.1 histidine phosphotransferase [Rhodobacter sp.]MCA3461352.1 histidine phosphotransferase [Rhodobacter sp.]MCA3464159.1 histidine phosphotransferase [Rhodobacter sp.]MCA3468316.1 histidine phosphotransferase [Rhodobacter sp.]
MTESPDFSALIGSRICHDLVNPISAIGNGIELMIMGGAARSPELALIEESVANANARIRFFRIAFGSGSDRRIARGEVLSILSDMTQGARIRIEWTSAADLARSDVRLAFLAIQCFETVMPYGGTLAVAQGADGWQITGRSSRFRVDEALWARLARPEAQTDVSPAHVQFALLPLGVADLGRHLGSERTETEIRLHF